ncbi:HalOD1 output domain-containing protein [Halorussus sp. MSC15.2]|uniref:HalOD1 output domain-containing protein n=1 Tax=Halorussus sp. MSC15.2 TaxID=2283638 RepID=UPI0013D7E1ED|nr:HalOD1 output domain-containing protein [Halorussus sp. MSC15.2]NEU55463.1 hypothetical protein [Halorussus sp. MSC15.2]
MAKVDQTSGSADPTVYRSQIPQTESVSSAVVDAVATASGRSVVRDAAADDPLDPLYETLDPEALDSLLTPSAGESGGIESVTFEYCGFRVTVTGARRLTVTEH